MAHRTIICWGETRTNMNKNHPGVYLRGKVYWIKYAPMEGPPCISSEKEVTYENPKSGKAVIRQAGQVLCWTVGLLASVSV